MSNPETPIIPSPLLVDDPMLKWELFWEKNKSAIFGAVALLILGGIALGVWFIFSNLRTTAAQQLLATATGIERYESVVSQYPGSMPAADALMRLAAAHREAGSLEQSTATFQTFLEKFPDHPLAGGALLGVGQNQDATGNSYAALSTYQQVVTQYPKSYAAPFAAYSEGEILLRRFQRDEALRSFNMVISQFPQSPAARMASSQLARLGAFQPPRASVAEPAESAQPVQ